MRFLSNTRTSMRHAQNICSNSEFPNSKILLQLHLLSPWWWWQGPYFWLKSCLQLCWWAKSLSSQLPINIPPQNHSTFLCNEHHMINICDEQWEYLASHSSVKNWNIKKKQTCTEAKYHCDIIVYSWQTDTIKFWILKNCSLSWCNNKKRKSATPWKRLVTHGNQSKFVKIPP